MGRERDMAMGAHGPSATTAMTCMAKGVVTFDDFCELLDFEDMPEEILAKCAHFDSPQGESGKMNDMPIMPQRGALVLFTANPCWNFVRFLDVHRLESNNTWVQSIYVCLLDMHEVDFGSAEKLRHWWKVSRKQIRHFSPSCQKLLENAASG